MFSKQLNIKPNIEILAVDMINIADVFCVIQLKVKSNMPVLHMTRQITDLYIPVY